MSLFSEKNIAFEAENGRLPPFRPPTHLSSLYDLCARESIQVPSDIEVELKKFSLTFLESRDNYAFHQDKEFICPLLSSLCLQPSPPKSSFEYIDREHNSIFGDIMVAVKYKGGLSSLTSLFDFPLRPALFFSPHL